MAQSVDQAYASLAGTYDPQTTLLNQQISQADVDAQAQQSSLDQAKVNAFKDIDTSANRKGILFSGFSPDQQASYVGTKYLPAVANLKSNTLNTKNTLAAKVLQLNAQRRQDAQSIVSAQQKDEQDQAYKQAQLSLSYARLQSSNSRASAGKAPTSGQIAAAITQGLSGVRGRDGYVSPQDYAQALGQWISSGQDRNAFNKQFKNFRNPNNKMYDYAIKQFGL